MILIIEEEQMADRLTIFRISLAFTDRTLSVLQLGYKSENSNDSSLSIFQTRYIYIYVYNNRAYVVRGSFEQANFSIIRHPSDWELNSSRFFSSSTFLNYSLLIQSPDPDWL